MNEARDYYVAAEEARKRREQERAAALQAQEARQRAEDEARASSPQWLDLRSVKARIRFTKELDGTGTFRYGPVTILAADLPDVARQRLAAWGDMGQWLEEARDDPRAELTLDARPLVLEHGANPTISGWFRAQNVAFHTLQGWRPRAEREAEERELIRQQAALEAERRAAHAAEVNAAAERTAAIEKARWDAQKTPYERLRDEVGRLKERVARLLGGAEET